MRHQGRILNRYIVFKSTSDGYAVCVDYDDPKYAFVGADPFQSLLDHSYIPHADFSSLHGVLSCVRFTVVNGLTESKYVKTAGVLFVALRFNRLSHLSLSHLSLSVAQPVTCA